MTRSASDVVGEIKLTPDSGLVDSLGTKHTLESAIADLVDNSLDAGAEKIIVRLLTKNGYLTQVETIDDGHGMNAQEIDRALTIGHRREYSSSDLGHFGMGLKAASFGNAEELTVWSKRNGHDPVGRRIRRQDFARDFSCDILSTDAARKFFRQRRALAATASATAVVWTRPRNAFVGTDPTEANAWLERTANSLRMHLGLTFHRLIESGEAQLSVVVDEISRSPSNPGTPVLAIDPFGYPASGHPDYPRTLSARTGNSRIQLHCHIWPPKIDKTGFRIGNRTGRDHQGFFVYRNNRLLKAGGWSSVTASTAQRQLARVVIDEPEALGTFITMNPEKDGVKFEPAFLQSVLKAKSKDGTTFSQYLETAEGVHRTASKRSAKRKPAIPALVGFDPLLRKRIASELPMIAIDPMSIKWKRLPPGQFLDADHPTRTLWLNNRYRKLFAPQGGSLNDAPTLKAALYLLTHEIFEGEYLGSRDRDNLNLWNAILGETARSEIARLEND
ncbi:ATP-binding protein [Dietzia sp. 111N12-1]|uniref:ATP-binding protein n=1 Tax=Dietzia sp. 111N12-1 TaxID=1785156 RepID=UPI0009EE24D7|nr:ATP-binding protein [Dietzia sp. 111N12-1]